MPMRGSPLSRNFELGDLDRYFPLPRCHPFAADTLRSRHRRRHRRRQHRVPASSGNCRVHQDRRLPSSVRNASISSPPAPRRILAARSRSSSAGSMRCWLSAPAVGRVRRSLPVHTVRSKAACRRSAERAGTRARCLVQGAPLTTIAYGEGVAQVAAGTAFLQPQRPCTGRAALVDKHAPVEVVNVASSASAHKTHRNDWLPSAIVVTKLPSIQVLPTHESSPTPQRVLRRRLVVLDDEPGRENSRSHRGGLPDVLLMSGWSAQFQRRHVQQLLQFRNEASFLDLLASQ